MKEKLRKLNLFLALWLLCFILVIFTVVWYAAKVFSYDICSAKAMRTLPQDKLYEMFEPTPEELIHHPSLVGQSSQITGFYREVLKCYRDSESRFFLWY